MNHRGTENTEILTEEKNVSRNQPRRAGQVTGRHNRPAM